MISEYHRPRTMETALTLLGRSQPLTYPLGGGTVLSRPGRRGYAVVDLQDLGLNHIDEQGISLRVGAAATLQAFFEYPEIQSDLREAIRREATTNLRNVATTAGALVSGDGSSTLITALLALDAHLAWAPGEKEIALGEWLPLRGRPEMQPGRLITTITLALNVRLAFMAVSRSPEDRPVVCAAVGRWPSGRTRLALGGYGEAPTTAMDGPDGSGIEDAARFAYSHAGDEWASSEYRAQIASTLALRCLRQVEES
ncbi:MAG: FAD binding domain-containing protein [Chloroflexi bacterium]|nr:FAD binding domain-containing protein [Chloroflexota bacterium]